jgi:hypothetical protein
VRGVGSLRMRLEGWMDGLMWKAAEYIDASLGLGCYWRRSRWSLGLRIFRRGVEVLVAGAFASVGGLVLIRTAEDGWMDGRMDRWTMSVDWKPQAVTVLAASVAPIVLPAACILDFGQDYDTSSAVPIAFVPPSSPSCRYIV